MITNVAVKNHDIGSMCFETQSKNSDHLIFLPEYFQNTGLLVIVSHRDLVTTEQ